MPERPTGADDLLGAATVTGDAPAVAAPDAAVPALTVLAHRQPERVGDVAYLPALALGRAVELSRLGPAFSRPGAGAAAPLGDPGMSRSPLVLMAEEGGVRVSTPPDARIPVVDGEASPRLLLSAARLMSGVVLELSPWTVVLLHRRPPVAHPRPPRFGFVGDSAALEHVRRAIERVAELDVAVLIRGETGTGKEIVARALHEASARRRGPFVAVNLGAIPASVAASELFGHVRGAFTGAVTDRAGRFRDADRGTLFLDEVGDASDEVQVALLRTLETGEVWPVGASRPVRVDVRVVAATDADLDARVAAGRFREALRQRLGGYALDVPPLRARRDDIGRLLDHFLAEELRPLGLEGRLRTDEPRRMPWLAAKAVSALARHAWPGNVRELRNMARRIVVEHRDRHVVALDLAAEDPAPAEQVERTQRPSELPDAVLLEALQRHGWEIRPTAKHLGISRTTLIALMDRCDAIRRPKDLTREDIDRCREETGGSMEAMAERLHVSLRGLRLRLAELGPPTGGESP